MKPGTELDADIYVRLYGAIQGAVTDPDGAPVLAARGSSPEFAPHPHVQSLEMGSELTSVFWCLRLLCSTKLAAQAGMPG